MNMCMQTYNYKIKTKKVIHISHSIHETTPDLVRGGKAGLQDPGLSPGCTNAQFDYKNHPEPSSGCLLH